ncbi:MAG: anthranilate synthase component I family protein [Chitinophagaceae bacterium]|nr:anthranilate synthase component I family protein [Chitinophagaceae bacterium]
MKRTFRSFPVDNFIKIRWQMLNWANQFNICCFLDSHQYRLPHREVECLAAAGATKYISLPAGAAFSQLQSFLDDTSDWLFGHLAYDLKNETESLASGHPDFIQFPDLFFFIPEVVVLLRENELSVGAFHDHESIAQAIFNNAVPLSNTEKIAEIKSRFSRQEYITTVQQLQKHMVRGDCYEINFCQEFYAEWVAIDPLNIYYALARESPNPFSSYYHINDQYLLCASPERYIKKTGNTLISQPIKGTARRHQHNQTDDEQSKNVLFNSSKDRSENIMIVDLVRNDLSRICQKGSVKVDELFGIYAFPQVYQMISTISGQLPENIPLTDIFKATFPMGSMTGAPKRRVMELIEQYEKTKRGLFSGAVGYITPDGNMDFNVVIRSILYNRLTRYLSFQTGSAITYYSNPVQEYEECILKAEAIKKVLNG